MKREYRRKYTKELKSVFPICSWHRCEKCGQEFRFEKGWRFEVLSFSCFSYWKYICRKCVPSEEEAHEYASNWRPAKPKSPPSPPKIVI